MLRAIGRTIRRAADFGVSPPAKVAFFPSTARNYRITIGGSHEAGRSVRPVEVRETMQPVTDAGKAP